MSKLLALSGFIALNILTTVACASENRNITQEFNLFECSISTNDVFQELHLKEVHKESLNERPITYFTLDHVLGEIDSFETDLFGVYEQVKDRIFTSRIAEIDSFTGDIHNDYQIVSEFRNSTLIFNMNYQGLNQDGLETFELELDGDGEVYELVQEKLDEILDQSDHYYAGDLPLCTTSFNLDDFTD